MQNFINLYNLHSGFDVWNRAFFYFSYPQNTSKNMDFQLAALRKLRHTTVNHRLTSREDVVLVSICFSPVWDGHSSSDCGGEASPGPPNVDGWPQQGHCKQSK